MPLVQFAAALQKTRVTIKEGKITAWAVEPTAGAGLMAILQQLDIYITDVSVARGCHSYNPPWRLNNRIHAFIPAVNFDKGLAVDPLPEKLEKAVTNGSPNLCTKSVQIHYAGGIEDPVHQSGNRHGSGYDQRPQERHIKRFCLHYHERPKRSGQGGRQVPMPIRSMIRN
jgi:hypothetical protein